jgi:8-oxo-dGTP pyrophosphatase MutT (NUDIX family)
MINTNEDRSIVTGSMTVVYAMETPPEQYEKSIFLAGPTPRSNEIISWRRKALSILQDWGYNGVVFVPEDRPDEYGVTAFHGNYDGQVQWENTYLNMADCILFWIPRTMTGLPGLTTNDEWGYWKNSGKVILGIPDEAERCKYQAYWADELNVPLANTLTGTVRIAMDFVSDGALRSEGEREVPLYIWQTSSFQQWYAAHRGVGNRLCHAKVEWTFRVGPNREHMFLWAMHVDIYIAKEQRHKDNEFVIARPDISTIIAYRRGRSLDMTNVVLVREFRSPASNPTAFVWEAPGGSSFKPDMTPEVMASEEFHEETGLSLEADRFVFHEARQLASTLSAHQSHVFSVELTAEEIKALRASKDIAQGVDGDGERTFVEVQTLAEIRSRNYVDWSMLGMIMQVLLHP